MIFQFGEKKKAQLDFVQTVANPNGGTMHVFPSAPLCNSEGDTGRTQLFSFNFGPGLTCDHVLV